MTSIAVLIASTSNNSGWSTAADVSFISSTIQSAVSLASDEFKYKFFIGYDHDDQFFLTHHSELEETLRSMSIDFELTPIDNSIHKPCPVWNALFEMAYNEGFDYFLQAGDDIEFSKPFDSDFISYLKSIDNIGVVGGLSTHCPTVITQAFLHRKHMDIFGFLYPPELPDWGSDTWLTLIYKKFKRARISGLHEITNTRIAGFGLVDRYKVSPDHNEKTSKNVALYTKTLREKLS